MQHAQTPFLMLKPSWAGLNERVTTRTAFAGCLQRGVLRPQQRLRLHAAGSGGPVVFLAHILRVIDLQRHHADAPGSRAVKARAAQPAGRQSGRGASSGGV